VDPRVSHKASTAAVRRTGLPQHISAHPWRHAFATHLRHRGTAIRPMPPRLGHHEVATSMVDTHILPQVARAFRVPWTISAFALHAFLSA
jgi:site-specific recombinase XerD